MDSTDLPDITIYGHLLDRLSDREERLRRIIFGLEERIYLIEDMNREQ